MGGCTDSGALPLQKIQIIFCVYTAEYRLEIIPKRVKLNLKMFKWCFTRPIALYPKQVGDYLNLPKSDGKLQQKDANAEVTPCKENFFQ